MRRFLFAKNVELGTVWMRALLDPPPPPPGFYVVAMRFSPFYFVYAV